LQENLLPKKNRLQRKPICNALTVIAVCGIYPLTFDPVGFFGTPPLPKSAYSVFGVERFLLLLNERGKLNRAIV
jgi:hypothetical protein